MNVPTGSFAFCAGVGHSTLAVAAGASVLGVSGTSGWGVSVLLLGTGAGLVMIICSGS